MTAAAEARPRIDLVSPLPPVRSGIADYTADLLPALAAVADLRLVALPGQAILPAIAESLPVVAPERLGEAGRVPLYQMGNNHHHEAVYSLALRMPGVLVLHDVVLHHFLVGRTAARGDLEAYRHALAAEHGWIGDAVARPLRWPGAHGDAAKFALPANRTLLGAQRGVLSHSPWAAGMLAEELPGLRLRAITMGIPPPPPIDAESGRTLRRHHGIPASAPLLGSFGFQTPIKRTDAVLRAMADPALADAWLVVGGELAAASGLEALAAQLGVAPRVRFLGYLPFAQLEAAIAAVDLCLNLRYPTAGETSASLLRILALGRPAVVSDHAQAADLPDTIVVKIPVGDGEARALTETLGQLLGDRARLAAMGVAARRHVAEHHRLSDAAAAVAAACRDWQQAPPLDPPPPSPPRPTSLILQQLPGRLEVALPQPWPEGSRRRLEVALYNDSDGVWLAGERGSGGIALEIRLEAGGRDHLAGTPWLGLAHDLAPGEVHRFNVCLRRPLGETRIHVEPHVLGRCQLSRLGGPVFARSLV